MEGFVTMTPVLYHSAVQFLQQKGIKFHDLGGAVCFYVAVGDEKDLSIIIIDLHERMATGEGVKIVVPDIVAFPAGADDAMTASMVNKLNSREDMVGKFTVAEDRSLRFALETVFPEDGGDGPEQIAVALDRSMDAVMGYYALAAEAANGAGDDLGVRDALNA